MFGYRTGIKPSRHLTPTVAEEERNGVVVYAADEAKAVMWVGLTEIAPNLCVHMVVLSFVADQYVTKKKVNLENKIFCSPTCTRLPLSPTQEQFEGRDAFRFQVCNEIEPRPWELTRVHLCFTSVILIMITCILIVTKEKRDEKIKHHSRSPLFHLVFSCEKINDMALL